MAEIAARIDTVSKSNFGKTVKQLETAIKGRGMMVIATIDHQNMLRIVGASVKGSKTLEFGKPDMMKMVILSTPETGLEMPMKIYVYEQADGKTLVSYVKPSAGFAAYGKADLKMVGQMMDKLLIERYVRQKGSIVSVFREALTTKKRSECGPGPVPIKWG